MCASLHSHQDSISQPTLCSKSTATEAHLVVSAFPPCLYISSFRLANQYLPCVRTFAHPVAMAEPLSIAGSMVGLCALADKVFLRTVRYIKAVKEAKKEAQGLSNELQSLAVALHQLYLQTSRLEISVDSDHAPTAFRPQFVDSCNQVLNKLDLRLEKISPAGDQLAMGASFRRRLKWPFSTSETKSLLGDLERHKSTVLLAVNSHNLTTIRELLSTQRQLAGEVRDIKAAVGKKREFELRFELYFSESDRRQVLGFFGKVNPERRHQTSKSLRHPNTGLWLLEADKFQEWLGPGSKRLWLSGIPGGGKTVLASVLIEETAKRCENLESGIAYFYCDYKDEQSQDTISILGSLAAQLARQSFECFELLRGLYNRCHPGLGQSSAVELDLLVDAIAQMGRKFRDVFLIVDALDECGKRVIEVTKTFANLQAAEVCHNVKLALFSREEEDIAHFLSRGFDHIRIAARSRDLSLFVAGEMDKLEKDGVLEINSLILKENVRHQLVAKADGM